MGESNRSQSIVDLVTNIENGNIVLPEFQRDFVWEQEKTYELFDSLIRDIFIGAIIYGKPSFDLSVREVDKRPRKGKGSRAKLKITNISKEEIQKRNQGESFRLVLDGQQRITSLYRALKGIDECWFVIANEEDCDIDISSKAFKDRKIDEMLYEISGKQDSERLCVKISDVYEMMNSEDIEEDIKEKYFEELDYIAGMSDEEIKIEFRRYIKVTKLIQNLFNKELLLPYYLLSMDTQKFALFFERSNSKGIQLNFIDILAAKLYKGFNLREKIEEAEENFSILGYKFGKEIAVRAISYIVSNGRDVDRKYILDNLTYEHFEEHWYEVYGYYKKAVKFLQDNHFIISYSWMPYENILIPIMIFLRELENNDFSQMNERQLQFIKYWYWASIFSLRYTSSSNDSIVQDCNVMTKIARNKKITDRAYFSKFRSQVRKEDDLLSYTKKGSAIYKGVLNLINYRAKGLVGWKNTKKLTMLDILEDHHVFPVEYLKVNYKDDEETISLIDCVLNRTLIPKVTNIKIGKKKPSEYLKEIQKDNPNLRDCLDKHLIPSGIIEGEYDGFYRAFLDERSKSIFRILNEVIFSMEEWVIKEFYQIPIMSTKGNIKIYASYYNKRIEAVFDLETKKILFNGKNYSVSQAADMVKYNITGNHKTSTNGWGFWRYIDDNNEEQKLALLREIRGR